MRAIQTDPRTVAALRPVSAAPKRPRVPTPDDVAVDTSAPGVLRLSIKGLKLVNALNAREHWSKASKRAAAQRALTTAALASVGAWGVELPLTVTITRHGPRKLDDDGATASAKHVRDAVAAWLGVDDGDDDRVTYRVAQQVQRGYGVVIVVEGAR